MLPPFGAQNRYVLWWRCIKPSPVNMAEDADSENREIFSITLLAVGDDIVNQHIMV